MTEWNRIEMGRGRPLVLLHGAGASSRVWLPVIDQLAAQRRVIALDFPGFGGTPAPPGAPFTMEWAMKQLGAELARLDLGGQVDMAGNSMGALMALEAAKLGMARSVVAVGPAGLWERGMPIAMRAMIALGRPIVPILQMYAGLLQVPQVRAAALYLMVKQPHLISAEEAAGMLADMQTAAPALRVALREGVRTRFVGGQVITVPVTIAFGSHDRMLPQRNSRLRDQLPAHTRWVTLPNCGHVPMWDHPDLVARTILDGTAERQVPTGHN
jgi:pimeloyl-ACP methyl ester carboxylesterase